MSNAYQDLIKRPANDMTDLEAHVRWSRLGVESRNKAAEDLSNLQAIKKAAESIDWESVADRISNPGDYIGDDKTAKLILKLESILMTAKE
jgi:hypothetical protein